MKLTFLTYNICSGRNHLNERAIEIDAVVEAISTYRPDVMVLNEVRGDEVDDHSKWGQTDAMMKGLGYPYKAFAHGIERDGLGQFGNAIISKFPIMKTERIPIPDPAPEAILPGEHTESRCVVKADVMLPGGLPVTVMGTHIGLAGAEKVAAVETVEATLETLDGPWIFAGDLNMTPDHELIQRLQASYRDAAKSVGVDDVTFPGDGGQRIDYIFISEHWRILEADVPHNKTSDHYPVRVTLELG